MDSTPFSLLEQASASVMSFLQHQVIYSTIAFAVVAVVAWVSRKKSPHWQLGLWSLILLRLVLPTDLGTSWSARSLVDHIPWPQTGTVIEIIHPLAVTAGSDSETVNHLPARHAVGQLLTGLAKEPEIGPKHLSWRVILFMFWLSGVTGFSILYIGRLFKFYQLIDRAAEIRHPLLRRSLAVWKERFCIKRPVRLVSSADFLSPFTVGVMRPVIFIPGQLVETEDVEITEMCIAHEMAHIRRWDDIWFKIQQILQIGFFFHPVVWVANRKINQAREHLCDRMVLGKGVSPKTYGRSMLKVLQNNLLGGMHAGVLPTFGNPKKHISRRLQEIVTGDITIKTHYLLMAGALMVLALVLLPMASSSSYKGSRSELAEPIVSDGAAVPKDIQAFLDDFAKAMLTQEMEKFAGYYSEAYLFDGKTKQNRLSELARKRSQSTFLEITLVECTVKENMATVSGFIESDAGMRSIPKCMLIKEDGQWKWHGNQEHALRLPSHAKDGGQGHPLPDAIQGFLFGYAKATQDHNIKAVADYYSERYLHSGRGKKQWLDLIGYQRPWRPILQIQLTRCDINGDMAAVEGYARHHYGIDPLPASMLVKEGKHWRWYGDQVATLVLPPDVQAFLDDYAGTLQSGDMDKVAHFFSEDYLLNGLNKQTEIKRLARQCIGMSSLEIVFTKFDFRNNIAHVEGFARHHSETFPLSSKMIRENGQWKWYGNQKMALQLPDDVQQSLDAYERAVLDADLDQLRSLYSDDYLENGMTKKCAINWLRQKSYWVTFFKIALTRFERDGDIARIEGAVEHQGGTHPILKSMLIKENGQWRLYGNQV